MDHAQPFPQVIINIIDDLSGMTGVALTESEEGDVNTQVENASRTMTGRHTPWTIQEVMPTHEESMIADDDIDMDMLQLVNNIDDNQSVRESGHPSLRN
jgi:hypothetical protein